MKEINISTYASNRSNINTTKLLKMKSPNGDLIVVEEELAVDGAGKDNVRLPPHALDRIRRATVKHRLHEAYSAIEKGYRSHHAKHQADLDKEMDKARTLKKRALFAKKQFERNRQAKIKNGHHQQQKQTQKHHHQGKRKKDKNDGKHHTHRQAR